MQLELTFRAKVRNRDNLIRAVQRLAQQQGCKIGAWKDGMRVVLSPAGYLDLGWAREGGLFGGWRISGGCNTTPAGPGLHRAAAEFLDGLGKELKELQVEDRTGYWEHRDFGRLVRESFAPWLVEEVDGALARMRQSQKSAPLFWDPEEYLPEEVPGTAYAPVGRFSGGWLEEHRADPDLGQRLFLWPNAGRDAVYHRNCALKRLWEECCFAPSDRSYDDEQMNRFILTSLERAHQLDPALSLPVSAYREVCILDGQDFQIPEDAPELEEEFAPGYRKREVLQCFDALWFPLPGVYRYEWDDGGKGRPGCIWIDEEGGGPIWRVSGFRSQTGPAEWNADFSGLKDIETADLTGGQARWGWKEIPNKAEPDEPLCQLLGEVKAGDTLYVLTVTFSGGEEREEVYGRLHRMEVRPKS